jgi:molybdenum cofactor guanylyltransferase
METTYISVGAVLAGGAGRRIGGHKATLTLAGKALVVWAGNALHGCSSLATVGDRDAAKLIEAFALTDPDSTPSGPLSGVLAALMWAKSLEANFLVTVPCDTPFLPRDCAERLLKAATTNSAQIACARGPSGLEPLVAAWHVETILPVLEDALYAGHHPPVHALMGEFNATFVDFSLHETTNINTLASLHHAEEWLQSGRN